MLLRRNRREVNGETYEYWTLVESYRTERGPRQRVVATLGKLAGLDQEERHGWEEIEWLLEGQRPPRQLKLGSEEQTAGVNSALWAVVDLSGVRVERARDFGEVYLALSLWRRLGLDELLAGLIEPGREAVEWEQVACLLTLARFCAQKSELEVAERLVCRQRAGGSAGHPMAADQRCAALSRLGRSPCAQGGAVRPSHGAIPLMVRRALRVLALRRDQHVF
jgi:hypothetical protein